MLHITRQLIDQLNQQEQIEYCRLEALLYTIIQYGNSEDAEALYECCKDHCQAAYHVLLLEAVMRLGSYELGASIYQWACPEGTIREDLSEEWLHVCGYLGVEEAASHLVRYVLDDANWQYQKGASLGLLHLQISEEEALQIRERIEATIGEHLFDEFLPALASKVTDASMIPKLYTWGDQQASIDSNAGLIIGIALFGSAYRNWIRQIVWNPNWQAHDTGTGTIVWTYLAICHVGLTFQDLIADVRCTLIESEDYIMMDYQLDVLYQLLDTSLTYWHRPVRFLEKNHESVEEIYSCLYQWSTPYEDDSIIGWIIKRLGMNYSGLHRFYHLRDRLEMKIAHHIEKEYLLSQYN